MNHDDASGQPRIALDADVLVLLPSPRRDGAEPPVQCAASSATTSVCAALAMSSSGWSAQ